MNQTNSTTSNKTWQHLSKCERQEIEKSLKKGFSIRAIAKALNRSPSTISREIKKGTVEQRFIRNTNKKYESYYITKECYFSDVGDGIAKKNLGKRGGKYKIAEDWRLAEYISNAILKEKLSPDTVIGRLRRFGHSFKTMVCTKTVYNYIDKCLLEARNIDLLLKVKRKPRTTKEKRNKQVRYGKSIDERANEILSRNTFGHYEGDTIVGKGGKSAIVTLVERLSGKGFLLKVSGKTSEEAYRAFSEINLPIKNIDIR